MKRRPSAISIPILVLIQLSVPGCGRHEPQTDSTASRAEAASPGPAGRPATTLPLKLTGERLARLIVESQHKRVWGRLTAYDEVERIVRQHGPFIEEASRQISVQPALRMMARSARTSLEQARQRWMRLHEADILLESGGREDAVSVANAVGVSQWIYGTGVRAGLDVDLAESNRLTARIDELRRRAFESGTAAPSNEIEALRAERRRVDQRYDPRPSIIAQARYLLRLYPRFPDSAWVMQAFHGGEAGVERTLKKYLGPAWPGSSVAAILRGNRGARLTFEHLYLSSTLKRRAEAFSYLYGRGDDHRYYWWKVRSALEAFALYRKDPVEFRRRWERFLPGRPKEAYWYPEPVRAAPDDPTLANVAAGKSYAARKRPAGAGKLRPEAKGALLLIADIYRRSGGTGNLIVGDTVLSAPIAAEIRRLAEGRDARNRGPRPPPDPNFRPGGGPRADFNFHETGLAFDIARPPDAGNRKILEYALGWLSDRHILWWRTDDIDSTGPGKRHYHAVPNPYYRIPLERIGRTGTLPGKPGE